MVRSKIDGLAYAVKSMSKLHLNKEKEGMVINNNSLKFITIQQILKTIDIYFKNVFRNRHPWKMKSKFYVQSIISIWFTLILFTKLPNLFSL